MKLISLTLTSALLSVTSLSLNQNIPGGKMRGVNLDLDLGENIYRRDGDHGGHGGSDSGHGGQSAYDSLPSGNGMQGSGYSGSTSDSYSESSSNSYEEPPKKEHKHTDMITPEGWFEMFPALRQFQSLFNLGS